MAFDPVPWAISGSELDTFVMREFAYMALQGASGVALPGHGKVTALGSPSGNVNIAAGGITVPNAQSTRGEQYVGQVASDTVVPIPPTSGSGRSDLIIATYRDPDFSPWTAYTDPTAILFGPYFYPERIPCSSSTVRASQVVSYSAFELARIDIPAGTTNITNGMITDLRHLARPRTSFAQGLQYGPASTQFLNNPGQTSWTAFPTNTLAVTVPTWATNCLAQINFNSLMADGAADAFFRINFGGLFSGTARLDYNGALQAIGNTVQMLAFSIFGDIDVRTLQGQTVLVGPEAERYSTSTGHLFVDTNQQILFDLRFYEKAI